MTSTLSVFIDESGTTNLQDNQGPTRYYVSTAVIVKTEDVPLVVKKLDEISSSFNGGTEFKNEKIRDDKRRIKLLNLISELPFQYFALVVDKQRIPLDSGFRFKTSYYKCINKHLYERLETLSEGCVDISIDNFGDHDFENSCIDFFGKQGSLFYRANTKYVNDKSNRLVQIADIISGTLRQFYFGKFSKETKEAIRTLLRNPKHEIEIHPYPAIYTQPTIFKSNSDQDDKIAATMLNKAGKFVEENLSSDNTIKRMQAVVLQSLIDAYYYENGPVYSDALLEKVNANSPQHISKQKFHSEVIGGIRHLGIILAGLKKGYRLAVCEKDINAYLDFDRTVILPMLAKLNAARTFVQTNVGHDILNVDRFKDLDSILNAYQRTEQERLDACISPPKERDEEAINEPFMR